MDYWNWILYSLRNAVVCFLNHCKLLHFSNFGKFLKINLEIHCNVWIFDNSIVISNALNDVVYYRYRRSSPYRVLPLWTLGSCFENVIHGGSGHCWRFFTEASSFQLRKHFPEALRQSPRHSCCSFRLALRLQVQSESPLELEERTRNLCSGGFSSRRPRCGWRVCRQFLLWGSTGDGGKEILSPLFAPTFSCVRLRSKSGSSVPSSDEFTWQFMQVRGTTLVQAHYFLATSITLAINCHTLV